MRALAAGDLKVFRELYTDAATMRHIGRPMSPELARASLHATLVAAREPLGPRFFVIVARCGRRAFGLCATQPIAQAERSVEIGIMLRRSARHRGLAGEALSALTTDAFRALPVDAVWAQYRKANRSAARLFDALGFSGIDGLRPCGARPRLCVRVVQRSAWPTNQSEGIVPMSNVIGFLESAGRDAALRHASREQLLQAMRREEIEPAFRDALMQPERMAIDGMLGVRETMYCVNKHTPPPKKAPAKKTPAKAPPKKAPPKKPAK
ncbi:MAG: GNAT family N-acetyltransferase [Proteobacteria bacterium]|nr:GNAT family N-acetyltransferase [Pseudomonadota bacterium]